MLWTTLLQMITRAYEAGDRSGVRQVYADAMSLAYAEILSPDVLRGSLAAGWRGLRRGHSVIVAVDEPDIVGFVDVASGDEPGHCYVYDLFVAPQAQGAGVGRRLMEAAHNAMDGMGATQRFLWVLEGNERAMAFYEREGWRRDGQRVLSSRGVHRLRYQYVRGAGA